MEDGRQIEREEIVVLCLNRGDGAFKTQFNPEFGRDIFYHRLDAHSRAEISPIYRVKPVAVANKMTRHRAYSLLCDGALSGLHHLYLRARSVTPDAAACFGYTTLDQRPQVRDKRAAEIAAETPITGVPGFWTDDRGAHLAGPGGLLMPIYDAASRVVGCQINQDRAISLYLRYTARGLVIPDELRPLLKAKYVWLSSAPEPRTSKAGKTYVYRRNGVAARACLHYPQIAGSADPFEEAMRTAQPVANNSILAVEGIHKSNMVALLWEGDERVVGQAGGSASHAELALLAARADIFLLGLDMDWKTNLKFRATLHGLIEQIGAARSLDGVYLLTWDDKFKGLDDYLLSGGRQIGQLPASIWRKRFPINAPCPIGFRPEVL